MWTQSGQGSSGQGCVWQQRGVCFNMSTWKILRGNIMDSGADVSLCLHAWNWGWALWSKWKCTAEVCRSGESELCAESKSESVPTSGFSQVPLQSIPSVIRDMGIPQPVALIHLSLGTACKHLASSVETLWAGASSGRPPMPAYFLPQSSFLYQLCSIISVVSPHKGLTFECKVVKQATETTVCLRWEKVQHPPDLVSYNKIHSYVHLQRVSPQRQNDQ